MFKYAYKVMYALSLAKTSYDMDKRLRNSGEYVGVIRGFVSGVPMVC